MLELAAVLVEAATAGAVTGTVIGRSCGAGAANAIEHSSPARASCFPSIVLEVSGCGGVR